MRRSPLPFVLLSMALFSCTGTRPDTLGVQRDGRLAPCPGTPNCVSSDADPDDEEHYIDPLSFSGPAESAWAAALDAVRSHPRTEVVAEEEGWAHAESTSRVFRFVDDVELHLRAEEGHIAIRSASRLGRSDLGVNRKRVEAVRARFRAALDGSS
ncbi:MAG: DUF1499 domain-containing protein [Rhodothermales bacterium]|nr:DUF1499 domain-containing protein [Rhodothermales bacterium]MBO6781176.1 DUF1499 domain-containing protein [Rhodothermales bacterium]